MRGAKSIWMISITALCLFGCEQLQNKTTTGKNLVTQQGVKVARATLMPTEGNQVRGEVIFTQMKNGVKIVANVEGLSPGPHGFHIHEFGNCSSPDGSSAGEHYNPTNKKHGCPDDIERHVGDLGNITADKKGKAQYQRIDKVINLNGPYSIVGKSIIVHEKPDDCKTQPSGNAGKRLTCGVIMRSQ